MNGSTCDTSVLLPALVQWHPDHEVAIAAVAAGIERIASHVLLECFSVLTRMATPHRFSSSDAATLITGVGAEPVVLPADRQRALLRTLAGGGTGGGAVYDALIAATAAHHRLHLLTRDRRARSTYDLIGVDYRLI